MWLKHYNRITQQHTVSTITKQNICHDLVIIFEPGQFKVCSGSIRFRKKSQLQISPPEPLCASYPSHLNTAACWDRCRISASQLYTRDKPGPIMLQLATSRLSASLFWRSHTAQDFLTFPARDFLTILNLWFSLFRINRLLHSNSLILCFKLDKTSELILCRHRLPLLVPRKCSPDIMVVGNRWFCDINTLQFCIVTFTFWQLTSLENWIIWKYL